MQTDVELSPEAYRLATEEAARTNRTLEEVVTEVIFSQLGPPDSLVTVDEHGLPVIRTGRPITSEEVAALIEED